MLDLRKRFRGTSSIDGRRGVVRPIKGCYASSFNIQRSDGRPRRSTPTSDMSYRVIAFTMAQVRQGSLNFHRDLAAVLRENPEIKVYSASPFDLEERRRLKNRFGGDIVYFFNEAAFLATEGLGLNLEFQAEIADEELPRRRTVVVGMPERGSGTSP